MKWIYKTVNCKYQYIVLTHVLIVHNEILMIQGFFMHGMDLIDNVLCWQGMEVVRSYTAVLPTLTGEQDVRVKAGTVIYLMIKIYKNGALTPWIDSLKKGT